uniref:Caspase n=1 Tax=Pithovirus LCPAC302 TaxID=2506593 RepID=A0A481Z738_9VIRU|nr:MAG: caspase [Pithovirus LCPAC302]
MGNRNHKQSVKIKHSLDNLIESVRTKEIPKSKKAVLVGLNYTGSSVPLEGCINDAKRMERTLKKEFKFQDTQIITDKNCKDIHVLDILEQLVKSEKDILFFQYSGHGIQVYDRSGDEIDGKDEGLYISNNLYITDDQINDKIKMVPKGTTMVIIIDACHSGSIIDLPYQVINNNIVKVNNNTLNGDIICISGCKDNQVSMDIKETSISYGAMSNSLQKVIKRSKGLSWRYLITSLRQDLKNEKYAQIPQLSVSRPELVNSVISL